MRYVEASETSIVIARRREVVWELLTDISRVSSWIEDVVEAKVSAKGDGESVGVGSKIDIARRVRGKRSHATIEITAFRPPSLLAVESRVPGLLVWDCAALEESAGGTDLTVRSEVALEGVLETILANHAAVLKRMNLPVRQPIYERSVQAFKNLVESSTLSPYR